MDLQSVLRLVFNLTFDTKLCEQMVTLGLLPRLTQLLREPAFRAVTLKILYHLSIDDACVDQLPSSSSDLSC